MFSRRDERFSERRSLEDGRRVCSGAVVRTANAEVMFGASRARAKSGKRYARNLAAGSRFRQKSVEVGHRFACLQDFCRIVPAATQQNFRRDSSRLGPETAVRQPCSNPSRSHSGATLTKKDPKLETSRPAKNQLIS
jgi:hypothetical protein